MPKLTSLIVFSLLYLQASSQKITYADFENRDFYRSRFDVIAKHNDRILVYRARYSENPFLATHPGIRFLPLLYANGRNPIPFNPLQRLIPAPANDILESTICIYDAQMKNISNTVLTLPKLISGVHFLAYDDFFYMFYQYEKKRTIYCMAAKIGMDGNMIGSPIELDRTENFYSAQYQSQIYTVVSSENRKHIVAFKMSNFLDSGWVLTSKFFDEDFHPIRYFSSSISNDGSMNFTEYSVDDKGNFLFLGFSSEYSKNNKNSDAFLYRMNEHANQLSIHSIIRPDFYTDYRRLFIDNQSNKYVLASFYSKDWGGDIAGLNVQIWDAEKDTSIAISNNPISGSVRALVSKNIAAAFDDFHIQQIRFRRDGSFVIQAQELYAFPHLYYYNRWNFLDYFTEQVGDEFIFYDPYAHNHYYPWKEWNYTNVNLSFAGTRTLFMSCDQNGSSQWASIMNTPQQNRFYATIGSGEVVENDLLYVIYNSNIKNKEYLVAQSINSAGEINTDARLKEDKKLNDAQTDLIYFPRFGKQISANEIVMPCRKGNKLCLAKIEF